jgi:hypothetical protein
MSGLGYDESNIRVFNSLAGGARMTTDRDAHLEQLTRRHRRLKLWTVIAAALAFLLGMLVCNSAR